MAAGDDDDIHAVVLDNGSHSMKAGFGGEDAPRAVFGAVVGRVRAAGVTPGLDHRMTYIGSEALSRREVLSIRRPIERGIITNWDDMETMWQHTFYEMLRVAPEEHPVVLSEAPLNPRANLEKMTQIMFETFNTPAMKCMNHAELVTRAYGGRAATGVVVDSGYSVTHVVPVYEGRALPHATVRLDYGGADVTEQLARLIAEHGVTFLTPAVSETAVNRMKEHVALLSLEYAADMAAEQSSISRVYRLTDPNMEILLGKERIACTEPLFNPKLMRKGDAGLHRAVVDAIMKCDQTIRKALFANIMLSGGNTLLPGFTERLQREIIEIISQTIKVQVRAAPDRGHAVWLGGSIFAVQAEYRATWISKEEYDESGPSIVRHMPY